MWTNRTLRQISRTGFDGYIPISTQIHSGISETFTPASSDSTGTRISIGTSCTSAAPPAEVIWSPGIGNKRQPATPNIRYLDKLDTSIDVKFINNLFVPPIFTNVVSEKLYNSSIWDLYVHIGMHLATDPVNFVRSFFVDFGFSSVNALIKEACLWTPATRVRGSTDVSR